ncbi:XRN 5'-3' exonuclease N-terminus-domain-containing protein [Pelagophyceae sp. CCMP2097]|nr:XRN 5'-3' exonuclease N-terminus-domain-containing protein [Pelagophyceae sp. CCMP2097]|mmetsp:Transcript_31989/g.107688  ORF Transcript_31989/g.107688 Transcript_31989/m.107688 type:complete len:1028 (-) Transcript_31989:88-3171(-)
MGVPAFFRWLSEKYPKSISPVHDPEADQDDSTETQAECDHLYVDMNGVIHPCAHPEDRGAPESEEVMFNDLLAYVDRLVAVTRPTTLIYLAIDGVAPRAKMNQQRARRWKAAKEAAEKQEMEDQVRSELTGAAKGPARTAAWDSNVITPGTSFMQRLSAHIRHGVAARQHGVFDCDADCAPASRKYWDRCAVIISDATVPGEGEHKIMAFVRDLRHVPDYDPNTRHVLHGLDADLIMLALATHEADFSILREEVLFGRAAKQYEEETKRTREAHAAMLRSGGGGKKQKSWVYNKKLQILRVSTLREYLAVEFASIDFSLKTRNALLDAAGEPQKKFDFDFERVIDDFVFLCFFVGNDFLPHLPSLDIREGALDMLLNVYKAALPRLGGYMTREGGRIDMDRLGKMLCDVGRVEDEIFQRRRRSEVDDKQRRDRDRQYKKRAADGLKARGAEAVAPQSVADSRDVANASAAEALKYKLMGKEPPAPAPPVIVEAQARDSSKDDEAVKRALKERRTLELDKCSEEFVDDLRLGEDGWKGRYYGSEFKKEDIQGNGGMTKLMVQYIAGLEWVLRYYYVGCVSWSWFFPFHYAPFASDLAQHIDTLGEDAKQSDIFGADVSKPFTPLQQLMAVLPAESAHAMPLKCRELINDLDSPLRHFYHSKVDVDPNGKAMPWLHVVLLPFVDVQKLLDVMKAREPLYDADADVDLARADVKTAPLLFAPGGHALAPLLAAPDRATAAPTYIAGVVQRADDDRRVDVGTLVEAPESSPGLQDIERCRCASATLLDPPSRRPHRSVLLPGAREKRGVLEGRDQQQPRPPPRLGPRGTPMVAELGLASHNDDLSRLNQGGNGTSPAMAALLLQPKRSWGSTGFSENRGWGSNEPRMHPQKVQRLEQQQQHGDRRGPPRGYPQQQQQQSQQQQWGQHPLLQQQHPLLQQQYAQPPGYAPQQQRHAFGHPGDAPPPRHSFHAPAYEPPRHSFHAQPPPPQQHQHFAPGPRPPAQTSSEFLQQQIAKALEQKRQQQSQPQRRY